MSSKTVKDLEWCLFNDNGMPRGAVFKDKLEAEAIKWVKEQRDLFGKNATGDFWMEKLNITEDDLKCQ